MEIDNIYLGDSYKLIKEIPDKSIDLIVTDPPYVGRFEKKHPTGIFNYRTIKYNNDIINAKIDNGFDLSLLDEFVRVMKKINIYLWCNKNQIYDYLTYFTKERNCSWEMIVWAKDNPLPFCSGHYLIDKEYCLYFWEQGAYVNPTSKTGKTVYVTHINLEDKKKYGHPTIKPIKIIENLISNSSVKGGVIFDPFSGSGTVAVACKNLDRHYIAFEINEKFYRTSLERLGKQVEKKDDDVQLSLF